MNKTDILKKLLPGFIPLFVFIAADEIWGTKIGLAVALSVGVIELIYTYIRNRKFDKFIILDTSLLVALGGVSIALDNDLFFKLKPAVIEAIMCIILAVSAFTSIDIIGGMTKKYMKGIEMQMNTEALHQFKRMMKIMFWIFTCHTILVLYSAFFMSKEAWAFISGGLFYILFGAYFLYEIIKKQLKSRLSKETHITPITDDEEWLPIVDDSGTIIGKAPRSACHSGNKIVHPVVHLHVLNPAKNIYLQKRPLNKLVQPGKWDTAVGGHISFGENLETALKREAFEEIGLIDFSARNLGSYKWESDIETELVYSFISYDYKKIKLHSDEVLEGKFWTIKQIEQNIGKGVFTPNFEYEFQLYRNKLS